MNVLLAHAGGKIVNELDGMVHFGALWLVLLPSVASIVGATVLFWVLGRSAPPADAGLVRTTLQRIGGGVARITGLPDWVALPSVTFLLGALPLAALGFYWDVAWHIDLGRDEVLFSPPHVALIGGLVMIGVAGVLGIPLATWADAPTTWRIRRMRVPFGAAAFTVAGFVSVVAFGADELWHHFYGLDVSMWGPTHLTMVSAAAFSPMAAWVLFAEAGPGAGHPAVVRALRWLTAGVTMVALSAWQLEFDLGVPQFQALYHPVLIAVAAGLGLTASRAALGRGGAVIAAVVTVAVRALFSFSVAGLGLTTPRFPIYLAAALAVEVAFLGHERRTTLRQGLLAGLGVVTVGLGAAWWWTHVWAYRGWQPSLLPGLWVAVVAGVAAAVLGAAAGRVATHRPSGLRAPAVAVCFGVLLLGVFVPLPRRVPDITADIRTSPAGEDLIDVEVTLDGAAAAAAESSDWFEVFAWQGGGSRHATLVATGEPGVYRTEHPMPVGGTWKTMVMLARGADRGVVPLYMPADEVLDAPELPVRASQRTPLQSETQVLQREAHAGPAWPAVIAYTWVASSIAGLIAVIVAGYVALDRRRRGGTWSPATLSGEQSLAGRRVVLTGAAGGIGRATAAALKANGAEVVGIDRTATDVDGVRVLAADLTDPDATERAIGEAERILGGIDVLVNNAGLGTAGDAAARPDDRAHATVAVNLFGTWNATAAAMPALVASHGHVVNIASGLAVANLPYTAAYSASKRAVMAYGDCLRLEHGDKVTVSAVLPGYVKTSIHAGPAADGASLEGLIPDEPVEGAAAAIVGAIESGRRTLASSPPTAVLLAVAGRFPRAADRVVGRRARRVEKPRFVRFGRTSGDGGSRPAAPDRPLVGTGGRS